MLPTRKMPSTKAILSTAASLAASAMLIRTIANDFIPDEARNYFFANLNNMARHFSSQLTIIIEEFVGLTRNEVFEAANAVDRNEEVTDVFENIELKWSLICEKTEPSSNRFSRGDQNMSVRAEARHFQLTFHKKHKEKVLDFYLPHILLSSKAIKEDKKAIKLHTVAYSRWDTNGLPLDHPMTFKNLAMDSNLLYGPPGTGKSSLIAAMANHLNYDIYDLDLTEVNSNNELRMLLLGLPNKSILVVEDIDCGMRLQNRESEEASMVTRGEGIGQVTLSGLLNFIDGIWSCCGDERVIVFTTNYKDRLDPALLRPGRMDMHLHMSYCTFSTFTQLAFNYIGVYHHQLFDEIKVLIEEVEVTPAEVAGELMKSLDPQVSLRGLIDLFHQKKNEHKKNEPEKELEKEVEH